MKTCSVEGCGTRVDARGWCKKHYTRWLRTGRTDKKSVLERLEAKTYREPNTGCWLFSGGHTPFGYGQMRINGRKEVTHRISWEIHNGTIPDGLWVLHTCDTPACINPNHLFLGTHTDNMRDCVAKGRNNNPQAAKTHCKRGHEFNDANTIKGNGGRKCRTCHNNARRKKPLK